MEKGEAMSGETLDRPDYGTVRRAAKTLLSEFDVSSAPVDPIEIAQQLGVQVKVVRFSGRSAKISGYYDCQDDTIYVNADEHPLRQTFTIAHELGHRTMHREWAESEDYKVLWRDERDNDRRFERPDPREQEANAFAADLLMPKFLLDQYVDDLPASRLSKLFAVSLPAMKARLSFLYG
jgi:Zn-dependent peptidase ImmA (M78 family)